MSRTDFRDGTTHAARAGALITGLLDLARRKSGIVNFVGCACQGAPQVILGIGVAAREPRAGQTENGFHARCRGALGEQLFGDPQVRDTPIGLSKPLRNLQVVQTILVSCYRLDGIDCRISRRVTRWSSALTLGPCTEYRSAGCEYGAFQQAAAVGCQGGGGVPDFHPRSQSTGQPPSRLLIGEASESAHVTTICAGPISLIQASQVATNWSSHLGCQRHDTDSNPGLKMSGTGLDHNTRLVTVAAHGGQYSWLGIVQIDQNIAGVVVRCVGPEIDIKALSVTGAEKSDGGFNQKLGSRPKPLARQRLSGRVVNQADQITVTGHGGELSADGIQRKKESIIVHSSGTSFVSMTNRGTELAAAKDAIPGNSPSDRKDYTDFKSPQESLRRCCPSQRQCLDFYPAGKRACLAGTSTYHGFCDQL